MIFGQRFRFVIGALILLVILPGLSGCSCNVTPVTETAIPTAITDDTVYSGIYHTVQDEAIDVVFIPDGSYGDMMDLAQRQVFIDDMTDLINNGFYQNNAVAVNLELFNFWYITTPGDVQPPTSGICPQVTWPDLTSVAFAEAIVLLHSNPLRDCAWGNKVTSEPTSYRTVVHEVSHAAFGLADEYCCDGGYWNNPPQLYLLESSCSGDADNTAWQDCQSIHASSGIYWWRSEDSIADMMSAGGLPVAEFGYADWFLIKEVLTGLGSSTVVDPSVYAPSSWDWPD